jgi:uncharacterized damage-inducible protein DinB
MNRKEVIIEQLQLTHNKSYWFVSFHKAIAGLTEEQAKWKNRDAENSIWDIISHLVFWNERYLNRFKGIQYPAMEGNNDTTFSSLNGANWEEVVDKFNLVMTDWVQTVKESEDEKLDQQVSEESPGNWLETLTSITLHNAYHIGQIVTIRKMQGSWSKEQGVS